VSGRLATIRLRGGGFVDAAASGTMAESAFARTAVASYFKEG
jgi:hypothetical protein